MTHDSTTDLNNIETYIESSNSKLSSDPMGMKSFSWEAQVHHVRMVPMHIYGHVLFMINLIVTEEQKANNNKSSTKHIAAPVFAFLNSYGSGRWKASHSISDLYFCTAVYNLVLAMPCCHAMVPGSVFYGSPI